MLEGFTYFLIEEYLCHNEDNNYNYPNKGTRKRILMVHIRSFILKITVHENVI